MQLRSISLLAVSICLVAAMPAVPASGVTIRIQYEGAAPFAFSSAADECTKSLPRSLGVACATVPHGARTLSFGITDASRLDVGGTYYVYDGATFLGSGVHCNGATTNVQGATIVVVRMEALGGPTACLGSGGMGTGEATKGVVNFAFS